MKLIRKIKSNKNGPKIAILGCVHGNETYSLKVFKRLKKINLLSGGIDFYLVNKVAFEKKRRFIDTDLNRSFNINEKSYEVNLAKEIIKILESYNYIIDLHSTTSKTNPFLIYVNENLKN
ncbi:MAG: succinylglutamate desuccinylase/aspartoacylase family protein, partial [Nanoarchaeota archaeon]|nr:succinylglutamate desuccinylase/aspartoacylase family protein [Nanoarchaeota archaeon]